MGTERWVCETGPCPCGQGTIEIEQVAPDHGWAQTIDYHPSLRCDACSKDYGFAGMTLVRKADADAYHVAFRAYYEAKAETDRLPILDEMRRLLAPVLEAMPTKVARHRWLREHGIESQTYGTFIKHWDNAERWVQSGVNRYNMLAVAAALGVDPSPIHKHEARLAWLRAERYQMPEAIPTSLKGLAA
jgi:hypothetical protein